MNYWDKRHIAISGIRWGQLTGICCSLDEFIWWCWSFSQQVNMCLMSVDQDIFFFEDHEFLLLSAIYCFYWERPLRRENVWGKLYIRARCNFMKSCLHVYFSSLGPSHPCLKELCFELFHFEFLSFAFYSFCLISSQVISQASLKGLFSFVILITTVFIFPASQPKFRDSHAKDNDDIPFDIESSGTEHQIIEIFFSSPSSSVKEHFSSKHAAKSRTLVTLCFSITRWAWLDFPMAISL